MEEEDKDLVTLLIEGSIEKAKQQFSSRTDLVDKCLKQWNASEHKVMDQQSKKLIKGEIVENWKLPIAYQRKIVGMAVAFLYGEPIKLKQDSKDTDDAFALLESLRKDMRMAAKDQECAKIQMSETEVAKLFVAYRDVDADPEDTSVYNSMKCIILAKSKGDIVHYQFDHYGVLKAVGREYKIKSNKRDIDHFDVYTAETYFFCEKINGNWVTRTEDNLIGKIPIVLKQQDESESQVVEEVIERREFLTSDRANANQRSGDPILVLEGEPVSLPGAKEVGKVIVLKQGSKASYLVPQMSVDMVKDEKEDLKEIISYITDTPDLSMDKMTSMGLTSGKAIEMAFLGPTLKAKSKRGYESEMIDREINIIKAFMTKVIDKSSKMAEQVKKLKVSVEFGSPLPDNAEDFITTLVDAVGGKPIMSQKTAVELNPLVKDADAENLQLQNESISAIED